MRSPVRFFVLAFAITWTLQLPALLARFGVIAGPQEKYLALVGLGAFGPTAAAMICARSDVGVRALFRPVRTWRVHPIWYAVALGVPGAIFVVAAKLYGHGERLWYPPDQPAFVLALFVFSIGEEIGWRGYALPALTEQPSGMSPIAASALIGVMWTFWHIPMLTLQGVGASLYVVFVPFMIGGSIFITWVMARTKQSLLFAVLAHAGAHLNNTGHALPARSMPIILHTIAWIVLAIGLVVLDRQAFAKPTGHETPVPPSPQ